jgi:hypothetical protein
MWLKVSDDFPDQSANLSDAEFRTHVEGLAWAMRRENGGSFPAREVKRFAESPDAETAVDGLLACGFWSQDGDILSIRHHMEHQVEPEVIAKRRADNAERQRRHRRKAAKLNDADEKDSPSPIEPSRPDPSRPDPGHASRGGVRNGVTAEPDVWGPTASSACSVCGQPLLHPASAERGTCERCRMKEAT